MNGFLRWVVLLVLLVAAGACYLASFTQGFGFFLGLGVLFELAFWFKLFDRSAGK